MSNEEIKEIISATLPSAQFDETGEWLNIIIDSKDWKEIATTCRKGALQMDFLFCLTCVDWKTHLTMVYHLTSTKIRHNIVIKANLDNSIPAIETVCDIWRTAEFHEREVFEMFGVNFLKHPDLRKLILEDDFKGFPLRKDFEDPINMIKL
ncbi:MAG: NADH-quinone oxidoreductase subunit C [Sediminibacterium sp.]